MAAQSVASLIERAEDGIYRVDRPLNGIEQMVISNAALAVRPNGDGASRPCNEK